MSSYRARPSRPDRAKAIAAVVLVHAGMGALLLVRSDLTETRADQPPTVLIDIEPPPPPPPPPQPKAGPSPEEEGAAGKKAQPTEIVAPPPRLPAPSPVAAAPVAGTGTAPTAGAADAGTGTGAGGSGTGRGGGGGGGSQARWVSGGLRDSDYPRVALRERISGTVSVRFTVLTSGRIANCRVARSSGNDLLDRTTCQLLTRRLRFRPATDAQGRAIDSEIGSDFSWGIRLRN